VTIGLDTNVLVYTANTKDLARHTIAMEVDYRAGAADSVLTLQSLAEFVRVMTGKVGMTHADVRRYIDAWRRVFRVKAADERAFGDALEAMAEHSIPIFDALLWATARRAGCTTIPTEDFQDGRGLGGVTFLNPFDPKNARRLDRILPKL